VLARNAVTAGREQVLDGRQGTRFRANDDSLDTGVADRCVRKCLIEFGLTVLSGGLARSACDACRHDYGDEDKSYEFHATEQSNWTATSSDPETIQDNYKKTKVLRDLFTPTDLADRYPSVQLLNITRRSGVANSSIC
jgi:hypothetical protein